MLYVHAHCSTLHNAHILAKISNTKSFLVCVCFPFVFSVTETMLSMCVSDRELVSYSSHVPICTYVWEAASFSPITTSVPSPDQIFSPPMFSTLKFFFLSLTNVRLFLSQLLGLIMRSTVGETVDIFCGAYYSAYCSQNCLSSWSISEAFSMFLIAPFRAHMVQI